MRNLIGFLSCLALAATAPAAVLLNEPFNYANGPIVSVSGSNWLNFSGTSNQVAVTNGRVALNLGSSEDVEAVLMPPATDTLYAGFTLRFTTVPPAAGAYFALFKDNGAAADFRARVWALTNGTASGGKFRLGLSSTTGTLNATNEIGRAHV